MPRTCTICSHLQRREIDAALVRGEANRRIASRFGLVETSVRRHAADHLPARLVKAADAEEAADAGDLLALVGELRVKAMGLLAKAEGAGDYRTALQGVREARACLELLAELEGELDRRPQVNLLVAPEWLRVRAALLAALAPYPEARVAVAGSLARLEAP